MKSVSFKEQLMCKDISEHIFTPTEDYCVYHPSNTFCNMHGFENWGISLRYSPVLAGEYSVM